MTPRFEAAADGALGGHRDLHSARIGPYIVHERLGAGGMGEVYEVEHEELGRRFALKLLRADLKDDLETRARFLREPRAMARLASEHVVGIVDCGELADGRPYFVMERLHGCDLRHLLVEQGILPVARVAHLAVDACRGLACAHRAGLVHRDLKPENLFVTVHDDGRDLCKLLDFGIVKSTRDNATRPGAVLGTTRYMAPEQLGLDVPVGPQTDLYALGVILYECLAGRTPFDGDTVERVLFKIMTEPEVPLRELRPEIPGALADLVGRALRKNPEHRFESALTMAEALLPFTHPDAPKGVAAWELQVAVDALAVSSRDLTPRAVSAALAPAMAGRGPEPQSRPFSERLPTLLVGLGLGAALALAIAGFTRRAAREEERATSSSPRTLSAPSAPSLMAASGSAIDTPVIPRSVPADDRVGPEVASSKPKAKVKLPSPTKPSAPNKPPTAVFDPRNPYAP